jgi:hypothetical protein
MWHYIKQFLNNLIKGATMNIFKKFAFILSVIGKGNMDMGHLSTGNWGKRNTHKPIQVSWGEGIQYLVGNYVEKFATVIERMDFARLSTGPEIRALLYATLASLLESGQKHKISIIFALPVNVMLDNSLARKALRELRSWVIGIHIFEVNEKKYHIEVIALDIFAQPGGGHLAWLLNDEGKIVRPISDIKSLKTIVDIGFNTNDVLTIQGSEIIGRHTGGNTAGIRRAAEQLIRDIKDEYDVTLSRHQADEYLRAKKPVFSCAQGDMDISPIVDQALSVASASIGDFLETLLGNGNQFRHMFFTGGGSALIKNELLQRYPLAQVLPNPVFANALGLARYARRAFPDASQVIGLDPGFGGFKAVLLSNEE